ncbi:PD-(D/E)XK nuclease domain-containing protein [Mediterranea massiliensis]
MEFKLDGTAKEALQQIHDKQYALPFASDSRKLFKVGVNFSKETRSIEGWIVED